MSKDEDQKRPTPTIPIAPGVNDPQAMLHAWCYGAVSCAVRGCVASLPGFNPQAIVSSCCFHLGNLIGHLFHGDLAHVLMARKACRESFLEGLRQGSIVPPPTPAPPPGLGQMNGARPPGT